MDIRNIKVDIPNIESTQILGSIFELGTEQLEGYLKIEGLPSPPLDINHPQSQVILKDFIGRVIEELTEGYESTSGVANIMITKGWNINLFTHSEYKGLLNHLQNANEEQADAIGFYITLLLYSNIMPEDIYKYVALNLEDKVNSLDVLMSYGAKLLYEINPDYIRNTGYKVFDRSLAEYFEVDYDKVISYTPGFHTISETSHEGEAFYLWQVVYQLNIARNLLKNRPWKQTQVMSKEVDYQEAIVKALLMYLGFLAVQGFNSESLFGLFYRKQQLNLWRQRTNY